MKLLWDSIGTGVLSAPAQAVRAELCGRAGDRSDDLMQMAHESAGRRSFRGFTAEACMAEYDLDG